MTDHFCTHCQFRQKNNAEKFPSLEKTQILTFIMNNLKLVHKHGYTTVCRNLITNNNRK